MKKHNYSIDPPGQEPTRYGENIFRANEADTIKPEDNCKEIIVKKFYEAEKPLYNYSKPIYNSKYAHFINIVWAGTERIGCVADDILLFCVYDPPGNVATEFEENVHKWIGPDYG